jgi:hypothetical protein
VHLDYQSYFDPDLVIEDDPPRGGDRRNSHAKFCEIGFSDSEASDLVASGYAVLLNRIVIDRYYGGPLLRSDLRTRFPLDRFKAEFGSQPNRLPVHAVTSLVELFSLIAKLQGEYRHKLLFRGQTGHYAIRRPVSNPTFVHPTLGETSLLPSVWRRVLKQRSDVWHQFRDLSMFEWSAIIYHLFDMRAVHEQERAAGFLYGIEDPDEVPDDPALQAIRDFHTHRRAFLDEYGMGSNAAFLTLLQHYGLYSPVLDLTTDPEVALFFATQKFARHGATCSYAFNGTCGRQAIIYVLYQDRRETLQYEHSKMLEKLDPQRPKRKGCVVMPTNEYAMNLAGDFLVAAIRLDFDMSAPARLTVGDLFPSDEEDVMLAALKSRTRDPVRAELTDFAGPIQRSGR